MHERPRRMQLAPFQVLCMPPNEQLPRECLTEGTLNTEQKRDKERKRGVCMSRESDNSWDEPVQSSLGGHPWPLERFLEYLVLT